MPNKTIYVSDDDMPLYQRAQELAGGNLSAAISGALRRYVEVEEGRRDGYDEITVHVGKEGAQRKQRFSGVLIGEWGRTVGGSRVERYRVYRTRKNKFALHLERSPEWASTGESGNWVRDLTSVQTWRAWLGVDDSGWGFVQGEATLEVFDIFEDLKEQIPEEFATLIATSTENPAVEDLDI